MKIQLIVIALFLSLSVAAHNWERKNYRNSTIFSASVWFDGKAASEGDVVAAFVGNECRMIAPVFISNDTAYISSVIHGENPETVTFRLWQQATDKVFDSDNSLTSKPGESIFLFRIDAK